MWPAQNTPPVGAVQVMVATDVAARGLDVRMLPYVVNYQSYII